MTGILPDGKVVDSARISGVIYRKRRIWDGSDQETVEILADDLEELGLMIKKEKNSKGRVCKLGFRRGE